MQPLVMVKPPIAFYRLDQLGAIISVALDTDARASTTHDSAPRVRWSALVLARAHVYQQLGLFRKVPKPSALYRRSVVGHQDYLHD